jgi:hypothetical protein
MIDNIINFTFQGEEIEGKILEINQYFIKVVITYPYINWENQSSITGSAVKNPNNNFLKTHEETSIRLLLDVYLKIKAIDESIDRICNVYDHLLEEINAAEQINDILVKDRIISKLKDWFYNDFLFKPSITGLITTITDKSRITEIIETYKTEKRKIYLK